MTEIFKPRANMTLNVTQHVYECYGNGKEWQCLGGPSLIWEDGSWSFYISGIGLHRLDGPATSFGDWYISGKCVTNTIYVFAKENNIDLENLSNEDKVLIALKFG